MSNIFREMKDKVYTWATPLLIITSQYPILSNRFAANISVSTHITQCNSDLHSTAF